MNATKNKLFLLLTGFLFLSQLCIAQTLGQLKTDIRRNMRDTSAISDEQRYSDALLTDFINEAQREIVNAARLSEKATSYILSPRTTYYTLPNDMIAIHHVDFRNAGGQVLNLTEIPWRTLYQNNANWDRTTGSAPTQYSVSQTTTSATSSTSTLRISYIPVPTQTSTGTVTIWYFNQVDDLRVDSDIPFNSKANLYPFHQTISYYVTMRLKLIEGRLEEVQFYSTLYSNSLQILNSRNNDMPNYNPSSAVLNRSR